MASTGSNPTLVMICFCVFTPASEAAIDKLPENRELIKEGGKGCQISGYPNLLRGQISRIFLSCEGLMVCVLYIE